MFLVLVVSIISGAHSYTSTAHQMSINALSNLKHLKAYATLNDSVNGSKLGETMYVMAKTYPSTSF